MVYGIIQILNIFGNLIHLCKSRRSHKQCVTPTPPLVFVWVIFVPYIRHWLVSQQVSVQNPFDVFDHHLFRFLLIEIDIDLTNSYFITMIHIGLRLPIVVFSHLVQKVLIIFIPSDFKGFHYTYIVGSKLPIGASVFLHMIGLLILPFNYFINEASHFIYGIIL